MYDAHNGCHGPRSPSYAGVGGTSPIRATKSWAQPNFGLTSRFTLPGFRGLRLMSDCQCSRAWAPSTSPAQVVRATLAPPLQRDGARHGMLHLCARALRFQVRGLQLEIPFGGTVGVV